MSDKSFVSIIIPVYNAENYIEKCLNSVIEQSIKNIEIIVINDGSTDNSIAIIERFRLIDPRIKYINQSNKGILLTRIEGIKIAESEFIIFLDSDDWLELNAIEILLEYQKKYKADMVRCRNVIEYGSGIGESPYIYDNTKLINENFEDVFYKLYTSHDLTSVWNQLMKKTLFNDIEFKSNVQFGDDLLLNLYAYKNCKSVVYITDKLWHYRNYGSSITRSDNYEVLMKTLNECHYVYSQLIEEVEDITHVIDKDTYRKLASLRLIIMMKNRILALSKCNFKKLKLDINEIISLPYLRVAREILKEDDFDSTLERNKFIVRNLFKGKSKQILIYIKFIYLPYLRIVRGTYGK